MAGRRRLADDRLQLLAGGGLSVPKLFVGHKDSPGFLIPVPPILMPGPVPVRIPVSVQVLKERVF